MVSVVRCGLVILLYIQAVTGTGIKCVSTPDCGWRAQCVGNVCSCDAGLDLHTNGRDCRNSTCSDSECLQCDAEQACTRCASFVAKSTGECLQKCEGSAEMQGDNFVCTESNDDNGNDDEEILIIAIVGGVAAGAVLCIIVIIIVCIYIRRTRRNINLQSKSYTGRQMDSGNVKKFSVYDNNAFGKQRPHVVRYL
ncbi:hypothetical protein ElyMa_001952200 [Elysia marginata]|uniref:Uncharacterized protein n=1 Tax=Elysia marginata TaxID=1093978 RepID=A0AAV4EZH6_9GAST|nr:hypothetical protein ElyMa_001952200 [Elysia marginata]